MTLTFRSIAYEAESRKLNKLHLVIGEAPATTRGGSYVFLNRYPCPVVRTGGVLLDRNSVRALRS